MEGKERKKGGGGNVGGAWLMRQRRDLAVPNQEVVTIPNISATTMFRPWIL